MKIRTGLLAAITLVACASHSAIAQKAKTDWPVYGGQPAGDHYSRLTQIHRGNVATLRVAWTYDTGETGGLQTSPIIVDGVLYGCTPSQKIIALDAATGRL